MSEWLCTNGLGSYASGTDSDRLTRRYHGLFVAALAPPLGRRVLLSKFDTTVAYDGREVAISSNRWHDGTIDPRGDRNARATVMDGRVAVTTYIVADAVLERRVWMEPERQQTTIRWTLLAASAPCALAFKAYVNDRDYHGATRAFDARDVTAIEGERARITLAGTPWYLHAPGCALEAAGEWYYGFRYERERERGLDDIEDLYHALTVRARLECPGDTIVLGASLDAQFAPDTCADAAPSLPDAPPWIARLAIAADNFLVRRGSGSTVIAGYHWFGDWGRDTMIALPGLTLVTGRHGIAREILTTFVGTVDRGMIPNRFPDDGAAPEYNTVDAALWFIEAVRAYHAASADDTLLAQSFDALDSIVDWYTRGTRYGIGVDPVDGLLRAGEPGVQLTWMDAKVGDWVVTPRIGKAIEVNALWYNALRAMDGFAQRLGRDPSRYRTLGTRVRASFDRFWNQERGYPYDVVDGPQGHDPSLRPNAVFAVALPFRAFDQRRERAIVDRAARELWTPMGLRSLGDREPDYRGRYGGPQSERDAAYHCGTAWPYLAGIFAIAYAHAYDAKGAMRFLAPLASALDGYGIGTLPEIADGDAPHAPRGCIAQAWSVAETLRAWHAITENR